MQRKTITVTQNQDNWIKSQIKTGQYGNDSEYIRSLIRADKSHTEQLSNLRHALIEGENSGASDLSMNDILTASKNKHANL